MRAFADAYPSEELVQQLAGQIPWWHNVVIITRLKDPKLREWYIRACIDNGWSRAVLVAQIETRLHERTGKAITNFSSTLPASQSELAQQILKDPYNFEFLTTYDAIVERDLQKGLLEHLKEFMLELGIGFAFVGSNYHLEIAGEDFYLDLLFYHLRLRSFVVVELKTTEFKPEYAGKLNFYLSAADDLLSHSQDNPSIGILLCRGKNRVVVEYSLRNVHQPIGVAEYQLAKALPDSLKGSLPTVEQLEAELKAVDRSGKRDDEMGLPNCLPCFVNNREILNKIYQGVSDFLQEDRDLLTNDGNERSISHKLAEHLQSYFNNLKVDCEYNRHGDAIKRLRYPINSDISPEDLGPRVFPDIVIHQRGVDQCNLVVIEIKKSNSNENWDIDEQKLRSFTGNEYKYHLGVFLIADVNDNRMKIERVFQFGQEITDQMSTILRDFRYED